jgi:hypothetical protein
MPATLRWLGLALLGILVAAAISIAASRLAGQQIGLASQPISAGDALAPRSVQKPNRHRRNGHNAGRGTTTATPTKTSPATTTTPTPEPATPAPPTTSPSVPPSEPQPGHDGEQGGGGGGGGADD